jgi:hypothetical protein
MALVSGTGEVVHLGRQCPDFKGAVVPNPVRRTVLD